VNMAKAIIYLYLNSDIRNNYSTNGHEFCKENFSFEKNFVKYDDLIQRLLRRKDDAKEGMHVCMESLHQ
ncbi:MAG: glycosyltransferase, partial [Clostridium sp.]